MNFYDLRVEAADGSMVSMSDFKGKVVLVVNTATGCGFTPQYKQLEEMYGRDNMLIHKSIVVFEKIEKILANKIWNGTLDWNWRNKRKDVKRT